MQKENQHYNIRPADRLADVSEDYFSRKLKEVAQMNAEGKNVISLGIGSPDMPPSEETVNVLCEQAKKNADAIMPGYTHLQRAQPITLAHHLLAYAMMLERDDERLADCAKRMNRSPLGACALAGTTYPIDRSMTARLLGFDAPTENSLDSVSDRDFCVELLAAISLCMTHLSRFSEEIILWSSWEFRFLELDDAYTTGSSIMPQKKNSDMAELVRGKTGRVFGDLVAMLTVLKGLPLAYNKDMQEDKEAVFDAVDTLEMCLRVFIPMMESAKFRKDVMYAAAQKGFLNATDLADYLVKKGLPFRSAYKIAGELVARCLTEGCVLETLPLTRSNAAKAALSSDFLKAHLPESLIHYFCEP